MSLKLISQDDWICQLVLCVCVCHFHFQNKNIICSFTKMNATPNDNYNQVLLETKCNLLMWTKTEKKHIEVNCNYENKHLTFVLRLYQWAIHGKHLYFYSSKFNILPFYIYRARWNDNFICYFPIFVLKQKNNWSMQSTFNRFKRESSHLIGFK